MLLDFTDRLGTEIADPWYTGNFDATYDDVLGRLYRIVRAFEKYQLGDDSTFIGGEKCWYQWWESIPQLI